ncbi:MAG: helix-hairpin-helix domain-containing protein [Pseudomonadota bacterium]
MDKFAFPTQAETEKMLSLPLGVASPLWLMFAGAASAGAAYYWTRALFQPTNLESLFPTVDKVATVAEVVSEEVEKLAEAVEETFEAAAEAFEESVEPEPAAPAVPDDLTRMTGIGPKMAAMLAEQGITRFAQIAAWTAEDVARLDKALKLMGRIDREAWIAQARGLL